MKVAIFARISTNDNRQNSSRQVDDLRALCTTNGWSVEHVVVENISGAKANTDRAVLQKLLNLAERRQVQKVVVTEASRIGRNVHESIEIIERLTAAGVSLFIQNIGMETLLSDGKPNFMFKPILLTLVGFAEMERELLRERIKSGLQAAQRNGKKLGRPEGVTETPADILAKYPKIVRELRAGLSVRKAAKVCDVSPGTAQKVRQALAG
jgi:DNA invertase Pin-like site-specific DNA recombinase